MYSFLSFSKYLLNSCCVLGIVLRSGGITEHQSDMMGCPDSKGFLQRALKKQDALSYSPVGLS